MSQIIFRGAAGTVTGSCAELDTGHCRLLVDCGLFQGNRSVRALNAEPFPFEAPTLSAVLLTHAHTDHTGLVPKLVRAGFAGPIYATAATIDLLGFMMADSARIQEYEAERENRRRQRRARPRVEPLYTAADAEKALALMRPVERDAWTEVAPGVHARFLNAGHMLGSASIEMFHDDAATGRTLRLLFSGDLGPDEKTFHAPPDADRGFDYVICESTYGDRDRVEYTLEARREVLRRELSEALARGGNVLVPCFAVERSQELLHDIGVLLAQDALPGARVYLDSPLATRVTETFIRHADTLEDIDLPAEVLFRDPRFRLIEDVEESKALNRISGGAIIISASGMADAGRIVHHLKNNIWREDATVLFVGYQSPGTTGAHILGGADEVYLHGKAFRIRATIRRIGNYSAHADQAELLDWIIERTPIAGALFLNHGDDGARQMLAGLLRQRGLQAAAILMPEMDERFELTAGTPASKRRDARRIEPEELQRDWHQDHAEFARALAARLDELGDAGSRHELLERLGAVLDGS